MINNETNLLRSVLCYEQGHVRRTQHILKVFALAKLFGEQEKLSVEEQQILQAAAILHDIAIKYCKEHCNGDASQDNQKRVAPILVTRFLKEANYLPSYIPRIIDLVLCHHDYDNAKSKLLQLLIEADLIVNCYESRPDHKKAEYVKAIFQTDSGKELLALCLKEEIK
ncbi:HD domain-containing protein [Intestinibacillus sp. Marseille-P6563]|uniref:HD domain-containing protein n=1 Tax=Intestinibacillus sp. Marseille-P6563 TaxID=2364792 RepID=UPI000F05C402|nr:HD domain-containing protein [Intestinibacillus sp. Marseille-P6563]